MSDMKCPFCKEELSYAQEIDGGFEILTCDCPHGVWLFGNDKTWYNLEKAITELERTRKALEQSETCCTEWEKQALDYKTENIALSGELERTRKALDKAKNGLKELKDIIACPPDVSYETCVSMYADGVLQEITTLEQRVAK